MKSLLLLFLFSIALITPIKGDVLDDLIPLLKSIEAQAVPTITIPPSPLTNPPPTTTSKASTIKSEPKTTTKTIAATGSTTTRKTTTTKFLAQG